MIKKKEIGGRGSLEYQLRPCDLLQKRDYVSYVLCHLVMFPFPPDPMFKRKIMEAADVLASGEHVTSFSSLQIYPLSFFLPHSLDA